MADCPVCGTDLSEEWAHHCPIPGAFTASDLRKALRSEAPPLRLFREHRGSLDASMATVRPVADHAGLVALLARQLAPYSFEVRPEMVEVKPYGRDERIGWDAHIVTIVGYGVAGFTDGPL